ncbi:MAG: UDP-N-acetylmuramate:L-alanyl-gamma-D-glutamyl-meso-diaminopimelate ligase [Gammaproteobacteria bacterium]|nr:UDP-N-acetylmuramate:L-alanyl-gamma-D-glutamyl-meso-diaminopimelate ligase [Gammaproteobacteria bacterium]
MNIHILGICGTFMGGLALLAREAGHTVSGSDANVYPPMSTLLEAQGIRALQGYDPAHLDPAPDCVVIGNALSRGNPAVEYTLARGLPYTSGPQWLAEHVLRERWVLAVAGTHGKTTTASLLAWILDQAGLMPGFLIGGVPQNFGVSARLGAGPFFVVEADEYDTAFFDKRSKFVHYRPRTLVLNNLEFDHADIFPDVQAIQRQFHHLVRTVPGNGLIVANGADPRLDEALAMGCWTPVERFAARGEAQGPPAPWQAHDIAPDGSRFAVVHEGRTAGAASWTQLGRHNVCNALAAVAAARHAGVPVAQALRALAEFRGVKRRLEIYAVVDGVTLYDDFAHHPTAIAATLQGLRRRVGTARIIALLEPRSNTMRLGVHKDALAPSLAEADLVIFYQPPDLGWNLGAVAAATGPKARVLDSVSAIAERVAALARPGDHVLIMSNGAFGGIHPRLAQALSDRDAPSAVQI